MTILWELLTFLRFNYYNWLITYYCCLYLCELNYKVKEKRAREWCESIKSGPLGTEIPYYETSAKEDVNVEDAFFNIAKAALSHDRSQEL